LSLSTLRREIEYRQDGGGDANIAWCFTACSSNYSRSNVRRTQFYIICRHSFSNKLP